MIILDYYYCWPGTNKQPPFYNKEKNADYLSTWIFNDFWHIQVIQGGKTCELKHFSGRCLLIKERLCVLTGYCSCRLRRMKLLLMSHNRRYCMILPLREHILCTGKHSPNIKKQDSKLSFYLNTHVSIIPWPPCLTTAFLDQLSKREFYQYYMKIFMLT